MKILITGLLISTMAFSMLDRSVGDWGSGGGNAIVCFNSATIAEGDKTVNILDEIKKNKNIIPDKFLTHIKSIEMYDLYEAKKKRGIGSQPAEILNIKEDEKIYEYIDRISSRFNDHNSEISKLIWKSRRIVPDGNISFSESGVVYQNDLGAVSLPQENCIISTMAAQVNYFNNYFVHIDQRLYDHKAHSIQSKAVLILHEMIYAYGRKFFDHKESGSTRELVRVLISYHESITEGFVSKFLVDSKFATGFGEFKYSNLRNRIIGKFERVKMNLDSLFQDFLFKGDSNLLFEDFKALYIKSYGSNDFNISLDMISFMNKIVNDSILNQDLPNLNDWYRIRDRLRHLEGQSLIKYPEQLSSIFEILNSIDLDDLGAQIYSYRRRVLLLKKQLFNNKVKTLEEIVKNYQESDFKVDNYYSVIDELFFTARLRRLESGPMESRFSHIPLRLKFIIPKEE